MIPRDRPNRAEIVPNVSPAAVIASAVIPTVIANAFYLPRHLLPAAGPETKPTADAQAAALPSVSGKAE